MMIMMTIIALSLFPPSPAPSPLPHLLAHLCVSARKSPPLGLVPPRIRCVSMLLSRRARVPPGHVAKFTFRRMSVPGHVASEIAALSRPAPGRTCQIDIYIYIYI